MDIDKDANPIFKMFNDPLWTIESYEEQEKEDEFFLIKYQILKIKQSFAKGGTRDLARIRYFDKLKSMKIRFVYDGQIDREKLEKDGFGRFYDYEQFKISLGYFKYNLPYGKQTIFTQN